VTGGEPPPDPDEGTSGTPVAVRALRGAIAVLVWGALAFPVGGMFRWIGRVLVMPPVYEPAWRGFVIAVGVVLFLAFFVEPYGSREGGSPGPS